MTPIPAGHLWALSTVGNKRHVKVGSSAMCQPATELSISVSREDVMSHEACKRCLAMTGGAQ